MSCNGHFLARSVADNGFIVADSELDDFKARHLLSPQADQAWRGDTDSLIQINLKRFELIDTLALCLHNMSATASIVVDFYDSRANPPLLTVSETVGGPEVIPQYKNEILQFDEVNALEIDITISDGGNPDGHIQIRRLKVGKLTIPVDGFDFGYTFGFVSGEGFRAGEVTWVWNTEDELNDMNELVRDYGVDEDKYARTRNGELLGFPDDILWLGYPLSGNQATKDQHTALVAMVGAELPYKPDLQRRVFTARLEEVYYEEVVEAPTAFIMTWRTTGPAETITLPAIGNSFAVDWGDGTFELVSSDYPSHEYAVAGDYVVSIDGICRKWFQDNSGDRLDLIEISQWGDVGFEEVNAAFSGCINLVVTAEDRPITSNIKDFSSMFSNCVAMPTLSMENWDTSSGTNFNSMISLCSSLTSLNLRNLDTSSGTNFGSMLLGCTSLESLDIEGLDVSGGTNFSAMLSNCTSLASLNLGDLDVSSGEDFSGMFFGTVIDFYGVSSWSIGSATNMTNMFFDSNLSDAEYDDILIGWAPQVPLAADFNMHFGTAKYTAATERAALVSDGITITDGGPA